MSPKDTSGSVAVDSRETRDSGIFELDICLSN